MSFSFPTTKLILFTQFSNVFHLKQFAEYGHDSDDGDDDDDDDFFGGRVEIGVYMTSKTVGCDIQECITIAVMLLQQEIQQMMMRSNVHFWSK